MFYTYRIALGDFDTDEFGSVAAIYCQLLFVANTVFTTIVLLNLFIAIISESFERISSQSSQASFREYAGLIAENQYLLSIEAKFNWCKPNNQLMYCVVNDSYEDFNSAETKTRELVVKNTNKLLKFTKDSFY